MRDSAGPAVHIFSRKAFPFLDGRRDVPEVETMGGGLSCQQPPRAEVDHSVPNASAVLYRVASHPTLHYLLNIHPTSLRSLFVQLCCYVLVVYQCPYLVAEWSCKSSAGVRIPPCRRQHSTALHQSDLTLGTMEPVRHV